MGDSSTHSNGQNLAIQQGDGIAEMSDEIPQPCQTKCQTTYNQCTLSSRVPRLDNVVLFPMDPVFSQRYTQNDVFDFNVCVQV